MAPWLKAGLIGGVILIILNLLGLIPCVAIVTCILSLVVYAGIGALAASWLPPVREAGSAAGQGALAAMLAALIGGVVNAIAMTIQMALLGGGEFVSQLPAEMLSPMYEAGFDPSILTGPVGGAISGSMCCLGGLFLAAILGAIGGAVLAGIRPE